MSASTLDRNERPAMLEDIEIDAKGCDIARAAAIFRTYGCLVVRGLSSAYVPDIQRDIEATAAQSISLLDQAAKITEGWTTPNGALFLPAPPNFPRDKQIMLLPISYRTSAAFLHSAFDTMTVDIIEAILGPDIELFDEGQCIYKEPVGGHPKHLHQDSAYFEHRFDGPVAILNYVVGTDLVNGALHVIPGTHKLGTVKHIDTFSHLGLDPDEWPWERAIPVIGGPGDAIFFHYRTVHGSKENHSQSARPVFVNRYRRPDDYVTVGASTAANRAENEKRAAEARKTGQRGIMVRGFRKWEPE